MDGLDLVKVMSQGYNLPSQPKKVDVAHVASKFNKPKQCFDNAYHYLDSLPTNITDCQYVIGLMLFRGIPVEHAWVKVNGQYFDPTLTSHADHEYYSLAELDFMELIDVAATCGAPSLYDYSRWLRKNPKTIEVTEMSSSTVDDHIDTLLSQLSSEDAEMLASRLASVGYPGDVEMLSSGNGASAELVQWAQSHGDPVSQEAGDQADTKEDVTNSSFGGDGGASNEPEAAPTAVAGWAGLYGSSPWVCVSVEIGQTEPVYNFFFDKADAEIFAGVSSEIDSEDKVTSAVTESHMDWVDTKKAWTDECLSRFPSCKHYNVNSNRVDARSNRRVVGYFMKNRNGGYIEKAPATESILAGKQVLIIGTSPLAGLTGFVTSLIESKTHAKVMVTGKEVHYRLDQLQAIEPNFKMEDMSSKFGGKYESVTKLNRRDSLRESTGRTRTFVQFAVLDGNTVSASRSTVGKLEAGVYDITVDYNTGMPVYSKKSIKSDSLLRFEDSRYNTVMEEVNGFWDMGPKYEELGYIHKRGFLMYGRPGVGKSCLSRLVIEDAINKDCVVFFSKDFREAVKCIQTFREIEESRKVLFVFEDLDEILGYSEHSFLEFMDGEDSLNGCLVLATTNYPERLPERVLRAGRMDVKVEIHNPPATGRAAYFKSKVPLMAEESLQEMVDSTDDFSFAECREFLVNHLLYSNPIQRAAQLVKAVDRLRVESAKTGKKSLTEGFRDKKAGTDKSGYSPVTGRNWDGKYPIRVGDRLEIHLHGDGSWREGVVKTWAGHYIEVTTTDQQGESYSTVLTEPEFGNRLRPISGLTMNDTEEATTGYSTAMSTNPTTVATEDSGSWQDKAGNKFDVYDRVTDGTKEYTVTGPISGVAMAFWCMDDEGNEVILDDFEVELVSKEAEAYEGVATDPGFRGTMNVPNVGTNESFRMKKASGAGISGPRWSGEGEPVTGEVLMVKTTTGEWIMGKVHATGHWFYQITTDTIPPAIYVSKSDYADNLKAVDKTSTNENYYYGDGSEEHDQLMKAKSKELKKELEKALGSSYDYFENAGRGVAIYKRGKFYVDDPYVTASFYRSWYEVSYSKGQYGPHSEDERVDSIEEIVDYVKQKKLPGGGQRDEYDEALDNPNMLYSSDITAEVQSNIDKAVQAGLSSSDPSAKAYAGAVGRAFEDYGLEGLVTQLMYLLLNLRSWKGDEARATKAALNSWIKKMNKKGYSESFRNRTASSTSPKPGQRPAGDTKPWGYYDNEHEDNEPSSDSDYFKSSDADDSPFSDNLNGYDLGERLKGILGQEFHVDSHDSQTVYIYFDGETDEEDELVQVEISDDGYYVGHARKGDYRLKDRENLKNSDEVADYIQDHMTKLTEGFRDKTASTGEPASKPTSGSARLTTTELVNELHWLLSSNYTIVDNGGPPTDGIVYVFRYGEDGDEDVSVEVQVSDDCYTLSHIRPGYGGGLDTKEVQTPKEIADYVTKRMMAEGFRDKTTNGKASPPSPKKATKSRSNPTEYSLGGLSQTDLIDYLSGELGRSYQVRTGAFIWGIVVKPTLAGEEEGESVHVDLEKDGSCVAHHYRWKPFAILSKPKFTDPADLADFIKGSMSMAYTEDNDMNTGDGSSSSSSSSDTQSDDEMLKNMSMHTDREDFEKKANELGVTIKKAPDSDYVYAYRDDQMVGEFDTKNNAGFLDQRDLEL